MRICILTTSTTTHRMGGTEVHAESLAAEAARQGHSVFVITSAGGDGAAEEIKDGYTVIYLPGTNHNMSRRDAAAWWAASACRTAEICASERIDVVWAENFSGLSYAGLPAERRRPVVSIVQGLAVRGEVASNFNRISTAGELLYFLTRYTAQTVFYYIPRFRAMVRNSDLLIAVSRETAQALAAEFPSSAAKTKVIFDPVDTLAFRPDPQLRESSRRQLGLGPENLCVLMSGVIHKQKGMHLGLEAFSGLTAGFPLARLIVAGDGPQLADLKKAAAEAGLEDRVIFCGRKENREMPAIYNAADVYLNPTLRLEGLGIVNAEAMACGLPCVVSLIGGTGSTIEDGVSGRFVKPGDREGLKNSLAALLRDAGMRERMATSARAKALRDFDLKKNLAAYVAASLELLEKRGL